jgi:transposase InsO family protein
MELGYAEEEDQRGADRDAALPHWSRNGSGQVDPNCLLGRRDLGTELRDELSNGEIFYSLKEAQIVIEQWRKHYNSIRPHSSLGYWPPARKAFNPCFSPQDQVTLM